MAVGRRLEGGGSGGGHDEMEWRPMARMWLMARDRDEECRQVMNWPGGGGMREEFLDLEMWRSICFLSRLK